jgi:hypothetical protein
MELKNSEIAWAGRMKDILTNERLDSEMSRISLCKDLDNTAS